MTDTPTSTALAEREAPTPKALVKQYEQSFMDVLPQHVRPETWVRIAQGALKKGPRDPRTGLTQLEQAATNNVGVFLATLLDAARLGLEPGTEQYYLTPRRVKGGGTEILGIVGYQGHIELMYRAGAVSSVVAECVYAGDEFRFNPGTDEVPHHVIDWDSDDRGALRLVYAFARMKDGATSKVVILNRADIARIKKSSQGADSEYSPWRVHEAAMWLKSAVRQLAKWIPTSAEYRNVTPVQPTDRTPATLDAPALPADLPEVGEDIDPDEAHYALDDEPVEAEIVDPDEDDPVDGIPDGDITPAQLRAVNALLRNAGHVGPARFAHLQPIIGRTITSTKQLTKDEASKVIDSIQPPDEAA